jgi:hypothetical protein
LSYLRQGFFVCGLIKASWFSAACT